MNRLRPERPKPGARGYPADWGCSWEVPRYGDTKAEKVGLQPGVLRSKNLSQLREHPVVIVGIFKVELGFMEDDVEVEETSAAPPARKIFVNSPVAGELGIEASSGGS